MTAPLELEDAQARLLGLLEPGPARDVPVDVCARQCLARPVIARRSQPPADLSAMDGYATHGEGPWRIVGESRAGAPFDRMPSVGHAVRISTGAQMPHGTDAVLVQEDAQVDGDRLTALEPPTPRFIRRKGLDFKAGDTLLEPGTPMGAGQIALVRAGGCGSVRVHDAPRVAILEVGDELHSEPYDCGPDKIPASNGAMLGEMARQAGGCAEAHPPLADDLDQLVAAIENAQDAALVVISGGASVGPHDLVKPALEAAGFTLDFWRVAIKPGKPLLVARRARKIGPAQIVLGLPGNPVSSYVTGFLFMMPAVRRLAGAARCLPRPCPLPLAAPLAAGGKRREFLRASWTDEGIVVADVQDSSALLPLAHAQVLIDRPADADPSEAVAFVPCYLLENGGYA